MKPVSCSPGWAWYLMAVLAMGALVYVLGILFDLWRCPEALETNVFVWGVVGFVGTSLLALGWHRFTPFEDGLHVRDLRGQRLHRWDDLGRPRTRVLKDQEFRLGPGSHVRGGTEPPVYAHLVCDARGRTLYHLGPWYPRRRELMREIRRRIRETL